MRQRDNNLTALGQFESILNLQPGQLKFLKIKRYYINKFIYRYLLLNGN